MAETHHDIHILNSLTKTTLDSYRGFEDAAEDAKSSHFASLFSEFERDRSHVASLLQAEVQRLGGTPETDSSIIGAAHRSFMRLKELFAERDDRAIINEVERGEDYIKSKFEAALQDRDISPSTRAVIEQAYSSVRAGHDRVSKLKHSLA